MYSPFLRQRYQALRERATGKSRGSRGDAQAEDQDGPGEKENRRRREGGLRVRKTPEGPHQEAGDEIADRIDRGEGAKGRTVLLAGHQFGGKGIFEGLLRAPVETCQDEDQDEQR